MLLAQLIDTDELMGLSPEELREMLVKLDDEVVDGTTEVWLLPSKAARGCAIGSKAQHCECR